MTINLINLKNGQPNFGLFDEPVDTDTGKNILKTKFGKRLPAFLKTRLLKQFIFSGVCTKDFIAGAAVADIKYAAKGFIYIYDIRKNILHESSSMVFPFFKEIIDSSTENQVAEFKTKNLEINFKEKKLTALSDNIEIELEFEKSHVNPLRLCSRTSYNGWFFTKKESSIPVLGSIKINNKKIEIDKNHSRGLTDRSLGFPGREIWWNWAAASTFLDTGEEFGMNLSWGINQTGETENIIWVNKKVYKLNQASFVEDSGKWFIKTNDNVIDLEFKPLKTKLEKENLLISATRFIQEIGIFKGKIHIDGRTIETQFTGWVEDHYVKW